MSEGTRRDRVRLCTLARRTTRDGVAYLVGRLSSGVQVYVGHEVGAPEDEHVLYLVSDPAPATPEGGAS